MVWRHMQDNAISCLLYEYAYSNMLQGSSHILFQTKTSVLNHISKIEKNHQCLHLVYTSNV